MPRLIAIMLTLAVLSTVPLEAASSRPVPGLEPLLRVHSQVLTALDLPATSFALEQRDTFISRGGFVQLTYLLGSQDRIRPILTRASSSPEALRTLNQALIASRAGVQSNCQIVGVPGGGFYNFIWYGRASRINEFQIRVTPNQLPDLPLCSNEVGTLLNAYLAFEAHLNDRPDAEILVPK